MSPDLSSPAPLAMSKPIVRTFVVPFVLLSLLSMLWGPRQPRVLHPRRERARHQGDRRRSGQLTGELREEVRHLVVVLPPGFEYSNQMLCFARNAEVSADCGSELGDPGGTDWFGNWIANNNPTYYALVGWPSLIVDGNLAVYAMRFVSALISSALLAWAFFLFVAGRQSRWGPAALAFAASP
jgi:hypothetical protein